MTTPASRTARARRLKQQQKQQKKEERGKYLPRFRFMAMSKMIGLIAFSFVFIITVYAMIEMHNTGDYSNLGQLIISAYGFASVYSGFYLLMAKVEHVETEKTNREKELATLKQEGASEEDIQLKESQISALGQKLGEIMSESIHGF